MNMAQVRNSKVCQCDLFCGFVSLLYMEGVYTYIEKFGAI